LALVNKFTHFLTMSKKLPNQIYEIFPNSASS
jgi:hypothetical protein